MNKIISIALVLTLPAGPLFAQKMPVDYFNEGQEYFEKEEYKKAAESFKYIVDHNPRNPSYPKAFYNMGFAYYLQRDYSKALPVFRTILASNFNEKESAGKSIMDDPYTNYKHRSSIIVSDIFTQKRSYDSALYYLQVSDTVYPYLHFCGNELASNRVSYAVKYGGLYTKLGNESAAVRALLKAALISLSDNSMVIEQLRTHLKTRTGLKVEFDKALAAINTKNETIEGVQYTTYSFTFMEIEYELGYESKNSGIEFDLQAEIKRVKESDFYKMISEL